MTVLMILASAAAFVSPPQDPFASAPSNPAGPLPQLRSPVAFVENRGQWDEAARFLVDQGSIDTWITDDGMWLQAERGGTTPLGVAIRMQFVGGRGAPAAIDPDGSVRNYLRGNDPSRWVHGARAFTRVHHDD